VTRGIFASEVRIGVQPKWRKDRGEPMRLEWWGVRIGCELGGGRIDGGGGMGVWVSMRIFLTRFGEKLS
jgi:hypothetical protein